MNKLKAGWSILTLLIVMAPGSSSRADLYSGGVTDSSSSHALAASANITLSGTTLTIVLTNTSTQSYGGANGKATGTDVLTAILISIQPPTNLNLTQATPTSIVNWDSSNGSAPTNLVGGAAANGLLPGGWVVSTDASAGGLGTSGFGIFNGNVTNGGVGNPSVNYGIINSAFANGDGNNPINSTPLVQNSITFKVTVGSGFSLANIQSVKFQYGSALSDPNFTVDNPNSGIPQAVAPEPGSIVMALLGGIPLLLLRLRRGGLADHTSPQPN